MKAIVLTGYGPAEMLQLQEVQKPSPRDNDVLIRVCTSTVTLGDCEIRTLTLPLWTRIPMRLFTGYNKPRRFIPGMEISGVIEAVGKNVTAFRKGDEVFGSSGMSMGGNAEFICRSAESLARKPSNVSFEDAATISVGGINALHFLRMANLQPGQRVLIIGAGGSIGTFGVQLAKLYGAEVTAVDHTSKLDMLRTIGADHVIDYTKEDFSKGSKRYEVIFDMVYKNSYSKCIHALTEEGIYLMANPGPRRMLLSLWTTWTSRKKVYFRFAAETSADLEHLAELISVGKLKPVIDRIYPLDQTREAHQYVEKGLKKGCVVIAVNL